VLPSLIEGMPMAVLEAMMAGVAPIVTPIGSLPEIVADRENGLLVDRGSADSLVMAVEVLANDRALLAKLQRNAQAHARANFDVARNARRLLSIYEELRSSASYRTK
jgi:glycosyltransferase involved in cell wall biosynthesis